MVISFFSATDSGGWLTGSTDDNRTLVKSGPFEYFQPTTVAETASLLATVTDSKVLAGARAWCPLFLMLTIGALADNPDPSDGELRQILSSNLCRCTGYQNIVTAVMAAVRVMRSV